MHCKAVDAATPTKRSGNGRKPEYVAIVGNPNAGKTTVFNALTGLHQKVANYPGVTVEKREGRCSTSTGRQVTLLDLPGTYSIESRSPDEDIVRDVLLGLREDTYRPDMVIVVVDASNLERNLYLVTQVMELGLPLIVALNMLDTAAAHGRAIDIPLLQERLCVPIIPVIASKRRGIDDLRNYLDECPDKFHWRVPFPQIVRDETDTLATKIDQTMGEDGPPPDTLALRMLANEMTSRKVAKRYGQDLQPAAKEGRQRLSDAGVELSVAEPTGRYGWINELCRDVTSVPSQERLTLTERMDKVLTHRLLGPILFFALMAIVFQSIYTWAQVPMNLIDGSLHSMGTWVATHMPEGPLRSLLVDGVLSGTGAVLVFLPQILFLFFFLALLEDSGYLARAAFIMDKLMSAVGLHGRSFIPLMSSFACAIPGIMATRTIENRRDRMVTILIAPLMSCSARLPVYILMIGAFVPDVKLWGFFRLPGITLLSMYLLGILFAMIVAWVFRHTLFKGNPAPFLLELPPYRTPTIRNVFITMWQEAKLFLTRAGTTILAISIILWFLAAYPRYRPLPGQSAQVAAGEQVRHSYAGRLGQLVEPVVRPLGFDWKIGIGLIGSFAAREVLVSTLATVYNVGEADEKSVSLREALRRERHPDGSRVYTPLVAVCLMIYFVLACQCMSTLVIVRRETNSWKYPALMLTYMTGIAYLTTFLTYQVGLKLGWG